MKKLFLRNATLYFCLNFFLSVSIQPLRADFKLFQEAHPKSKQTNKFIEGKQKIIRCDVLEDYISLFIDRDLKTLKVQERGETSSFYIDPQKIASDGETFVSITTDHGFLLLSNDLTMDQPTGDSYTPTQDENYDPDDEDSRRIKSLNCTIWDSSSL